MKNVTKLATSATASTVAISGMAAFGIYTEPNLILPIILGIMILALFCGFTGLVFWGWHSFFEEREEKIKREAKRELLNLR